MFMPAQIFDKCEQIGKYNAENSQNIIRPAFEIKSRGKAMMIYSQCELVPRAIRVAT